MGSSDFMSDSYKNLAGGHRAAVKRGSAVYTVGAAVRLFRRSLATYVALVGGIIVVVGSLVRFFSALASDIATSAAPALLPAALVLLASLTVSFFILLTSRPRLFWWPGRRWFSAIILVVLGILAFVFSAGFVLTEIGAVLAIVGGVLLPVEGLFVGPFGGRRPWLRRGFF